MKRIGLLSVACAIALTAACNGNGNRDTRNDANTSAVGTTGEAERGANSGLKDGDKDFVHTLSIAGMAEVELGKMAGMRAVSADVKRFGQMMVTDHTKAGEELKQVASRFSIPMATALDEKHMDLRNKLAMTNGAQFDREYIDAMVQGHEDVLDTLQTRVDGHGLLGTDKDRTPVAEKSDNPATMAINQWAAMVIPTVRMHLDEAKRIQDRLQHGRNTTN